MTKHQRRLLESSIEMQLILKESAEVSERAARTLSNSISNIQEVLKEDAPR